MINLSRGKIRLLKPALLAACILAPLLSFTGCSMTPEDKAFYGRGWINPDELDEDTPPPRSFTDPTAIDPKPLPPGPG